MKPKLPKKGDILLFRWSHGDFITKIDKNSPADPDSTYVEMQVKAIKKAVIEYK